MSNTMTDRQLIDNAKSKLVTKAKASKESSKAVEAADANLANELLAKRGEIYDAKKKLTDELAEIDAIIKDMIGNADQLTVHGAKVASIARWRETALITETVKTTFPVAEYPELYKRTSKTRLTVH